MRLQRESTVNAYASSDLSPTLNGNPAALLARPSSREPFDVEPRPVPAANAAEFDEQQEVAVDAGLLFYYRGAFSTPAIHVLSRQLKQRLEDDGLPALTRQRLFSTFLVMAHNVLHHGASDFALPPGAAALGSPEDAPHGTIAIGANSIAGTHWVMCHNLVEEDRVERLSACLDRVQAMNAEQIEAAHRARLLDENRPGRQRAPAFKGLGLMTIARNAREPLHFSLRRATPKPCGRFHLYLTAVI